MRDNTASVQVESGKNHINGIGMKAGQKEAPVSQPAAASPTEENFKTQVIREAEREEYPIIKKIDGRGKITFHHSPSSDGEIETFEEELDFALSAKLESLHHIVDVLKSGADDEEINFLRVGNVLEVLLRDLDAFIQEMFSFIHQKIGIIKITQICDNQSIYRPGRCVDAHLKPAEPDAEGPIHEHDPKLIDLIKSIPPGRTAGVEMIMRHVKNGGEFVWSMR